MESSGCDLKWDSLVVKSVLDVDWHTKYISLLVWLESAKHPEGAETVILAHKQGFDSEQDLLKMLLDQSSDPRRKITLLDANDIYYRFIITSGKVSECKMTAIHPATSAHISKYTKQTRRLVSESPKTYTSIVEPWIMECAKGRLKWVENILDGTSEQDRLIYSSSDPMNGFMLLPDSKWDQASMSSLYLLALGLRKDVRSLRDLTGEHLPLLRNIRDSTKSVLERRFGVDPRMVRMYVHYPPTYYYFHVHIVHVDLETPGCSVGVAHLLDDIVDNIELKDDYYQQRTLHYYVGTEHDLIRKLGQ